MQTINRNRAILESSKTSPRKFVEYRLGLSGSFYTNLFEAYFKADCENKNKLESVFPELIHASFWQTVEGYHEAIREWALENGFNEASVVYKLG